MRAPKGTDFTLTVDGIGAFTFGRRNMADQFKIQAEHARLTEGVSPVPQDLDLAAIAFSALKVLTVHGPDGWDIDLLDPLEDDSYHKILQVFGALRAREEMFRAGNKKVGEATRAGEVEDAGVLVPAKVQPAA